MEKAKLRQEYKLKRNELSLEEVKHLDDLLLEELKAYDWSGIKYLHCYLSIEKFKEYNTLPFIKWIWKHFPEITIVISKSDFQSNELTHYSFFKDTSLELNSWGIPEPIAAEEIPATVIDAIITPMLVVDMLGNRVGYGKGFYDRFFVSCKEEVKKLGVSYFPPVDAIDDIQEWDIPIDLAFTPGKTFVFNKGYRPLRY
ncbi:5-formyltetrahydrofolate cyclo-ligase [Sphingobacterium kyonggiense]